jgi:GNAT superfamily N-acetyltransferase
MWWRLGRSEFEKQKGPGNKRAFKRIVNLGPPPGLLAYAGREPVGWCALARRESYPVLERSRVLARVDREPVWSVPCFFVARPLRGQGVSAALLKAAVTYAREHGVKIVEGYPVEPKRGRMADVFAYTGLAAGFRRADFVEVARRSPTRPLMRYFIPRR